MNTFHLKKNEEKQEKIRALAIKLLLISCLWNMALDLKVLL